MIWDLKRLALNLMSTTLNNITRILAGIIVSNDKNESRQTKKPARMSCNLMMN